MTLDKIKADHDRLCACNRIPTLETCTIEWLIEKIERQDNFYRPLRSWADGASKDIEDLLADVKRLKAENDAFHDGLHADVINHVLRRVPTKEE